ncbi:MAG TPA: hypothetical protein VF147_10565 [Vicinamibacterales bacterium]
MIRAIPSALRVRAALGLRPLAAPVMLFIPLGFALGPRGIGVLSASTLSHMDVVVSIALATLGVFIGIAAGTEGRVVRRLAAASTVEAGATVAIVGGAVYLLLRAWEMPLELSPLAVALVLGICASASSAPVTAPKVASRVADLDDVGPIVAGAVVLALLTPGGLAPLASAVITGIAGIGAGAAGWLLFDRVEGAERNVLVLGTLALIGGCAAYVDASPLFAGLAAGWFWAVAPGHADRIVADDLQRVQHPLVVLVLIVAGAALTPSAAGLWLLAPYVVFRVAGKLVGGWIASRIAPGVAPSDLGAFLISPGVIGVAFALNVEQVAPGSAGAIAFAASAGAIVSELLAVVVAPEPART